MATKKTSIKEVTVRYSNGIVRGVSSLKGEVPASEVFNVLGIENAGGVLHVNGAPVKVGATIGELAGDMGEISISRLPKNAGGAR